MASFTKRGKTWQYIVSRMVNGESKPIRKGGFPTKKEAQIAAAEVESKLSRGITPHLQLVPLDEYFETWVTLYKSNRAKGTKVHYKNTLRIIREYFNSTPLQQIQKSDYQLFINEFGRNKARETVKKINSQIRSCIRDAIDEGILQVDFTRKVVLSGRPGKKAADKYLDYDESQKLLHELQSRIKTEGNLLHYLILLALTSGLRFAELIALTRKDFDFKNNTLTINKAWGYSTSSEQGAKATKTTASERVIVMDVRTMNIFKDLFENTPDNIARLVFYQPISKYKTYSNTGTNKILKSLLKELKLNEISIHGLRHTHASVLLYKGVSIQYISERLGHTDIDTTIRVYAHMVKELRDKDEAKTIEVFATI